jgi:lysophospholipase L1-like esterase
LYSPYLIWKEGETMYRNLFRITVLVTAITMILAACGAPIPTTAPSTQAPIATEAAPTAAEIAPTNTPEPTAAPSGPSWTYVAFGDSWPYGAHCNGCRPFPVLYADGLAATTDHRIDFVNFTTNGGTSRSLLKDIQTSQKTRDAVMSADIIVISTGANDLEDAFGLFAAGNCGGVDNFDCFRKVGEVWHTSFDGILTEINTLRAGKPTALRLVTNSNEALSDPGLIEIFGPEDSSGAGAFITNLQHEILCEVAAKHGAKCVDLRPVLNGPNFDKPQDVNTQEAMQAVADALLASGLDELP